MKFQALALALFASTGLSIPIAQDDLPPVYTLRLSSRVESLDGAYITANGTLLGVYSRSTAPVQFTPVVNPETGLAELRTYPEGSNALALIGSNDLLDFASLEDPAGVNVPDGTTVDWTSFKLDEGAQEEGNVLEYVKGEGVWVAFPRGNEGDWSVKWKGVEAWTTTDYMPVKVVYELAETA
ncbi:hypothetical protein MMYC01_205816 [Madurella mycetomatis]|uniref:Uncharacterized protein n=1 Tax=Madurella mycetomatis TaxID=100816 RepID=A0A175VS41_9PEZI|nr:hypothetical protein MMYC01_209208 [Madurella mycetomatis]KXX76719.1 hypothetical protein MMYC01_205816 [Madurella mycetomatis]